jgi:hypothetical protein
MVALLSENDANHERHDSLCGCTRVPCCEAIVNKPAS